MGSLGKSSNISITIPQEFVFVNCTGGTSCSKQSNTLIIVNGARGSSINITLTLTAPSFTNDNLNFAVKTLSKNYSFSVSVYLNPSLPKPMNCSISKSSNTTLLIHNFTTTCSIGSLGVNPSDYIGIIIPPYVSPIKSNIGSVSLIVNNNVTYSGEENITCYNQTNSSIFGDLNGYCIFYVRYNSNALALSFNDSIKLVVSNYFRSYPST